MYNERYKIYKLLKDKLVNYLQHRMKFGPPESSQTTCELVYSVDAEGKVLRFHHLTSSRISNAIK